MKDTYTVVFAVIGRLIQARLPLPLWTVLQEFYSRETVNRAIVGSRTGQLAKNRDSTNYGHPGQLVLTPGHNSRLEAPVGVRFVGDTMAWLRGAYRGVVATWKNDLFKVTVRPVVLSGLFMMGIDTIRSAYHHDFSRMVVWAPLCVLLAPFLFIWWQRNKT